MSLLGVPFEQGEIDSIQEKFPEFEGEVPEEAKYWSQSDLELFFRSNGQLRPRETAKASMPTCSLLTRLRQRLAEDGIEQASAEYRSFCRHLRERDPPSSLPSAAECASVPSAKGDVARPWRAPVLLSRPRDWTGRSWNMDFWKREYGDEWWKFRARSPAFENDRKSADLLAMEGTVSEYIDYVRVIQKLDPSCLQDNAIAFPRVSFDSWCPFAGAARGLFAECWKELAPEGVEDHSARWMKSFASVFNLDWLEFLGRYYKVTIGVTGAISRLRVENHGAHAWFTQIEGRRLFFLFPPQEAGNLYQEPGGYVEGPEGYAALASPVDAFFPSQKRHSRFGAAKAQVSVLTPGDTLVVPSGWWQYSVALEPSVTLHHPFWNRENKARITSEFKDTFVDEKLPPELREKAAKNIEDIHEEVMEEGDDSDVDG